MITVYRNSNLNDKKVGMCVLLYKEVEELATCTVNNYLQSRKIGCVGQSQGIRKYS